MSCKTSVFIATSLDGFIARKDGSIDWLHSANARVPSDEDCGYNAFIDSVDVLVIGRNTYELSLTFPQWPYGSKRVVVLSSRSVRIPSEVSEIVSASSEAPADLVRRLSSQAATHLYIDGGVTIQRFLEAGLIDELTITVIPVLLGEGRSLFGPLGGDIRLTHVSTKAYEFGYVQNRYRVTKDVLTTSPV